LQISVLDDYNYFNQQMVECFTRYDRPSFTGPIRSVTVSALYETSVGECMSELAPTWQSDLQFRMARSGEASLIYPEGRMVPEGLVEVVMSAPTRSLLNAFIDQAIIFNEIRNCPPLSSTLN
jgi:hypothetical protein